MQEQELKELLARIHNGTATDAEKAFMENWYLQYGKKGNAEYLLDERIEDADAIWTKLQPVNTSQPKLWPRIAAVAASIIFVLGIGSYFYFKQAQQVGPIKVAQNDIPPGKNSATLTLANGKKIVLSDAVKGQIAKEAGVSIKKTANGQVVYTIADNNASEANQLNTLSTARGETYKVNLPDGTQVWLNAASSLTYPARFTGANRQVTLEGEGYFEVAHDKIHPFLVQTVNQTVTVLGTHFNINAYSDEPAIKTTLLEGSVKINAGSNTSFIKPGQQAILRATKLSVDEVDTDDAIDWKNGMFQFSDESLESIMRKVSRWYDVDIEYENVDAKKLQLTGVITHFTNVSGVLKILEHTKKVHFKIDEKKIIVMK